MSKLNKRIELLYEDWAASSCDEPNCEGCAIDKDGFIGEVEAILIEEREQVIAEFRPYLTTEGKVYMGAIVAPREAARKLKNLKEQA